MKKTLLASLLIVAFFSSKSQILPREGSKLNYRMVGFSFPVVQNATQYIIEIASGRHTSSDSFKKNIIKSINTGLSRTIAEVPIFGCEYTWRVTSIVRHTSVVDNIFHHFSTIKIPSVDTSQMRLRLLKKTGGYNNYYIFLDGHRGLYDMDGNAIWYVPLTEKLNKNNIDPRDLKMTPQCTLTLLVGEEGYEINYQGDILWTAPDAENEHYHHEMTRLSNGNYMLLGYESVNMYLKPAGPVENGLVILPENGPEDLKAQKNSELKFLRKDQFSKVIEYDPKGDIVRTFTPSKYFAGSDLYYHRRSDGNIDTKVHNNGFYYNEKNNTLYLSFKEINRILKVTYPGGKFINAYGPSFAPGATHPKSEGLFCKQHHCSISGVGNLLIFNNNYCNENSLPTVVVLEEPATKKDSLKKIWEYSLTIDNVEAEEKRKLQFPAGGSIYELPDHSFFVNMGGDYSKVFIVNRNKEIQWSALPEKWQPELNKWMPFSQYRASIITRDQLERLIWNNK